ncbi:MAG TPA: SymE family type I addiction module toxin [Thermoanaerobaculia bacterium]|jgi:hypothetical protein
MPKKTAAPMPHPLPPSRRGGMDGLRELTVTTLHRTSAGRGGREEAVPYLRISGRWLEQYGLTRGCRVVVSGEPGKLVLTVAAAAGASLARG